MKPKQARIVAAVIAGLLVVALLMAFVVDIFASTASAASTVSGLNNKLNSLEQQQDAIEKKLKEVKAKKQDTLEQKAALDQKIAVTNEEIATINTLIHELDVDIAQVTGELKKIEADEQKKYSTFLQRVRVMEEEGDVSYLGVILSADSFSSMLSRTEIINDVVDHDKRLMDEIKTMQAQIKEKKGQIEANRSNQVSAKQKLASRKASLQTQTNQAKQLISTYSSQEEEYKKAYTESETAMGAAKSELKELLRKQAAKKKKSNSGSSGGPSVFTSIKFTWPTPGYSLITSPYGMRFDPIFRTKKMHTGVDIGAPYGATIVAAASGTVVVAGWSSRGYGNYVVISHDGTFSTLYAHQSKLLVSEGQTVSKGEAIGKVGSTGYSTGAHLHFEVLINGDDVNPMSYFRKG